MFWVGEMGVGEKWMEQFMTEKRKLITTQFGFLSGQHGRRGTVRVCGRQEWPTYPSPGPSEPKCLLLPPLSQSICQWLE